MIKETTENLYPFIVSQLPKKYRGYNTRTHFDDVGIPLYTALLINKGPRHYFNVLYKRDTKEFSIGIRKPQGYFGEVIIHKYA